MPSENETKALVGLFEKQRARFASAPEQNSVSAFEAFIEREQPFALLVSYIAGNEEETAAIIQRRRIPVIQPVTLSTGFRPRNMRYVFYLSSGIEGQCAALGRLICRQHWERKENAFVEASGRLINLLSRQRAWCQQKRIAFGPFRPDEEIS